MREKILRFFEYLILVDLSLFIILAPYSSLYSKIFIYSSAFLWILFCLGKGPLGFFREVFAPNIVNKVYRLFFLVILIATRFSLHHYHSQGIFFSRYLGFTLAFILGSAIAQKEHRVKFFLKSVVVGSLLIGLGSLWDLWQSSFSGRLFTSFGHDVNLSSLLALYFPFVTILALWAKGRSWKWGGRLSVFCLMPAVIWNMSRAVWISIPASILLISLLLRRKRLFLGVLACLMIAFAFFPSQWKTRVAQTFDQHSRIEMSKAAIEIFEDFPVFGAGVGMYEEIVSIYEPDLNFNNLHTDNTFTEILAEMGLIGLTVFIWMLVVFIKNALAIVKLNNDTDFDILRIGLSAAMISALIVAFATNSVMVGFQNAVIFWLLFGLASGMVTRATQSVQVNS